MPADVTTAGLRSADNVRVLRTQVQEEIEHQLFLFGIYHRARRELEVQIATLGVMAPPASRIQLQDTLRQIAARELRLVELGFAPELV